MTSKQPILWSWENEKNILLNSQNSETKEVQNQEPTFANLEKNYENNEWIKDVLNFIESDIESKLETELFSAKEIDTIKLTLLNDIFNTISVNWMASSLLSWVLKPLLDVVQERKAEQGLGETIERGFSTAKETITKLKSIYKDFGIDDKMKDIHKKIDTINQNKKKNPTQEFWDDSIEGILDNTQIKQIAEWSIYTGLKTKLDTLSKHIHTWKERWEELVSAVEWLPFGEDIVNWLKEFAKDSKFWSFILTLIFWKEFLDEGSNRAKKSVKNLKVFVKEDGFPLKDNIKEKDVEKLDSQKLSKFYKFLDNKKIPDWEKKIDYTNDTFWKELLTWDTKNQQILDLYNMLKWPDWNILKNNEWIDNLVKKLNWLEKVESKKEAKERKSRIEELTKEDKEDDPEIAKLKAQLKHNKKTIDPVKRSWALQNEDTSSTTKDSLTVVATAEVTSVKTKVVKSSEEDKEWESKITPEKQPTKSTEIKGEEKWWKEFIVVKDTPNANEITKRKEIEAKLARLEAKKDARNKERQHLAFIESVTNVTSLPATIEYNWKPIVVNIENNQITLDWKSYKIGLKYTGEDNSVVKRWDNLFKWVKFEWWTLKVVSKLWWGIFKLGEKVEKISKDKLVAVLKWILEEDTYSKRIENVDINISAA